MQTIESATPIKNFPEIYNANNTELSRDIKSVNDRVNALEEYRQNEISKMWKYVQTECSKAVDYMVSKVKEELILEIKSSLVADNPIVDVISEKLDKDITQIKREFISELDGVKIITDNKLELIDDKIFNIKGSVEDVTSKLNFTTNKLSGIEDNNESIMERFRLIDEQFDSVDLSITETNQNILTKFSGIDDKLVEFDKAIVGTRNRFDAIEGNFVTINESIDGKINKGLASILSNVTVKENNILSKFSSLENSVSEKFDFANRSLDEKIKGEVATKLSTQLSSITSRFDRLEGDVSLAKDQLNTNKYKYVELESYVKTISPTSINDFKRDLEDKINNVNLEISGFKTTISSIGNIDEKISTIVSSQFGSYESNIDDIVDRKVGNKTAALQSELNETKIGLDNAISTFNSGISEIESLKTTVSNFSSTVENISALDLRLATAISDISALETSVSTTDKKVESLNRDVSALKLKVPTTT